MAMFRGSQQLLLLHTASALVVPPLKKGQLYLGIDLSTQSCTGTLLDGTLSLAHPAVSINFDERLPEYGTSAGMTVGEKVKQLLDVFDVLNINIQAIGLPVQCLGLGSYYYHLAFIMFAPMVFAAAVPTGKHAVHHHGIDPHAAWVELALPHACRI